MDYGEWVRWGGGWGGGEVGFLGNGRLTAAVLHAESSGEDFSLEGLHCVNVGGGGSGMVEGLLEKWS